MQITLAMSEDACLLPPKALHQKAHIITASA
jgi:hypothetical protein